MKENGKKLKTKLPSSPEFVKVALTPLGRSRTFSIWTLSFCSHAGVKVSRFRIAETSGDCVEFVIASRNIELLRVKPGFHYPS